MNEMKQKKRIALSWVEVLTVILVGILVSMAGAAMLTSVSGGFDRFYDEGEVFDADLDTIKFTDENLAYNVQASRFEVLSEVVSRAIKLYRFDWKFCIWDIKELNKEGLNVTLQGFDSKNRLVFEKQQMLTEGRNIVELEGKPFSQLIVQIQGQPGTIFELNQIQVRDNLDFFSWKKFCIYTGIGFLFVTTGLSILLSFWKKKRKSQGLYQGVILLQVVLQRVLTDLGQIQKKRSEVQYSYLASGIMLGMLWVSRFMWQSTYRNLLFFLGIAGIIFCYRTKMLHPVNWRNPLAGSFLAFSSIAVISDFLVPKSNHFPLAVELFLGLSLCFLIGNLGDKERIIKDFMRSIGWYMGIMVIFCFLTRPLVPNVRYMGFFKNPNSFGMALTVGIAVLLTQLAVLLKANGGKLKAVIKFIEIDILFFFIWKTQSRTSILCVALMMLLFAIILAVGFERKKCRCHLAAAFAVMVLLVYPVFAGGNWILEHVPKALGTTIRFDGDAYLIPEELAVLPTRVYAAEGLNNFLNRIKNKVSFNSFTSQRMMIWERYIKDANLLGHPGYVYFKEYERTFMHHNGFVYVLHRYGLFAVIPYLLLLLLSFVFALKYAWRGKGTVSLFPLLAIVGYIVTQCTDVTYTNLASCSWFSFYLSVGFLFQGVEQTRIENKGEQDENEKLLSMY